MMSHRNNRILVLSLLAALFCCWLWLSASQQPRPQNPASLSSSPSAQPALVSSPNTQSQNEVTAEAAEKNVEQKALPVFDEPAALAAIQDFSAWADAYIDAPEARRAELEADGEKKALARREQMAQMIRANPKRALELAAPWRYRTALPENIRRHLEEKISAKGTLGIIVTRYSSTQMSKKSAATISGKSYNAHVYGRRVDQMIHKDVPLYGIALGSELALSENPVRPLEADEARAYRKLNAGVREVCPVSNEDSQSKEDETLVEVAGEVLYLCSGGHIITLNDQLIAQEGGTTPAAGSSGPVASAWTTGNKTVLYIIVRFSDQTNEPQSQTDATNMMNTVANWFNEVSYGLTSMTPTITPCFVLPQNEAYYNTNGDYTLQADARAVAKANGYDYATYSLDAVRWNGGPGSYGGQAYVGSRGCWLKSSSAGVAEHEFGHNYGLWHANYWNAPNDTVIGPGSNNEYGDPFDVMGAAGGGAQHFNAYEKNRLDWIPTANVTTVTANGTYRIYAFDSTFDAANKYALKVVKDSQRDYWVNFRQKFTSNKWLMSGVQLLWDPYSGSSGSLLLDTTPSSPSGKTDSAVVIGRTFSDYSSDIHFTPIAKGGTTPESIDVVVNKGTWKTDRPPVLSLSASATAVATNTNVTFTATASDPDGDALAYDWDFGDNNFGTNSSSVTKSWSSAREYVVRCTVSDMKGGTASQSIVITVGSPAINRISGTVRDSSGNPVANVRVWNGLSSTDANYRYAFTGTDGTYTLVSLSSSGITVSAARPGWTLTPSFTNPVTPSATGKDFTATPTLYTIAGKVTTDGTTGLSGAVVSDGTRSEPTDASGNFTLYNVPNGSYTLTATKSGYNLVPHNFSNPVAVDYANVTSKNFYNNVPTYTISGEITGVAAGTAVTVTDGYRTTTSYRSGQGSSAKTVYSLSGVPAGTWTLRAYMTGTSFSPSGWSNPLTISGSTTGKNFAADATVKYSISGTVTDLGSGLSGVSVSTGAASATSDPNGGYYIGGLSNGTYTVTPSKSGFSFTPANRSVTINNANSTGQNFATTNTDSPPTVATPASATPNPVTAKTTNLSVLGADNNGEAALVYTWSTTGTPPAAVTFSVNNANSAKNTVATFSKAGSYTLRATIKDANNGTVTSDVVVNVNQTASSVTVAPSSASVSTGATQQFTATLNDQFNNAMSTQPSFTWSVSGGGTINTSGLFTAGATSGGPFTVTATGGGFSSNASVTVTAPNGPGSGILREWWTGIAGTNVSDLTGNANYPNTPSGSVVVTNLFEAPTDWADNYGTRMHGYFIAPVTGSYYFYIASDDSSQLFLSTDASPSNKTQIASVSGFTGSREWTKYASQKSAARSLVAGQRYYIEALQKEGTGGDNLAVGVELPGGGLERPIPYHRLDPWVDNQVATKLAFSVQPSNTQAGSSISPAVKVAIQDASGVTVSTATNAVTIVIGTNPGTGTLGGTLTVNAVSGVATFSNLSIDKAGTGYTLVASATNLTSATSNAFNITLPTVAFSATNSNGSEATTTANLAVTLSAASTQSVSVNYAVTGGTATGGGTDYTLASGTLTFNAGETSKNIAIAVVNDTIPEANETIQVTLSSPVNANLGTNTVHTYTINDNDAPSVSFSAASSNGSEATTPANLAVTLSVASTQSVSVNYAVTGGTATGGGTDYTLASGTLTFNAGETSKNIAIAIVNDTIPEANETIQVTLSSPVNAALGTNTVHTFTINDNDTPSVAFSSAASNGSEATTPANLAVTLSAASTQSVSVNYAVTGGTATGGGTDYTLASGTLTFNAGETSKNIAIAVVNDTIPEANETIQVTLSSPVNANLGTNTVHTYTINDNDAPSV
ncbi:MAG TPA: Calx-beta domain-containing protein, partial [Planctomycetota bacterium]|nr:Calx-beta domain-containing protein [Planctomycetota bacterium]